MTGATSCRYMSANRAGITIVQGHVGIGKTFALRHLAQEHRARGTKVHAVTCCTETSGHIKRVVNELLYQYGGRPERNELDAAEALWCLVAARPFDRYNPTRSLLIVDEAQRLKPRPPWSAATSLIGFGLSFWILYMAGLWT